MSSYEARLLVDFINMKYKQRTRQGDIARLPRDISIALNQLAKLRKGR